MSEHEDATVELECGHSFHKGCIEQLLRHGWSTLRISFDFLACPSCKDPISQFADHPDLDAILDELYTLRGQVKKLAGKYALREDIVDMKPVYEPVNAWFQKPLQYVLATCAFYQCHGCKEPFYGG